jgi:hypothetical protein
MRLSIVFLYCQWGGLGPFYCGHFWPIVPARVWSSGICGAQSGAGTGFLRVLRFPLPIFIPQTAPQSPSPIIWGWYNRPEMAAVQGT